jgi:hypothetical protein
MLWNVTQGLDFVVSCDHGNEPSSFIKGGEFTDYLSDCPFSGRTLLHRISYMVSFKDRFKPTCQQKLVFNYAYGPIS